MIYKRIGHWHLDVTIHGVRYREALNTTDKRQAKELEKNRIAEIKQGKNASKTGREFARKPFHEAVKVYLEEREPHVSERTMQFETERLGPLLKHFGERSLLRFKAEDVSGYQKARLDTGISGRTVNMETGVLRRMLKRAKVWNAISEDVKALPEDRATIAKVLPPDLKRKLLRQRRAARNGWSRIARQCSPFRPPVGASRSRTSAGRMWTSSTESRRYAAARRRQVTGPFH